MKILVTGCVGFIGSHISEKLLTEGHIVIGIDNFNDYYPLEYKKENLQILQKFDQFTFHHDDLLTTKVISQTHPEIICHLAALAGVRNSLEKPKEYARNNIEAFIHLLEESRKVGVKLIVYASSSSVYGLNSKVPFSEDDDLNLANSSYACSKICMEIYAQYYERLYSIPSIGLRFFTVYGPRGRPDMAPYKFLKWIHRGTELTKFGTGESFRDYTYIDDIVQGIFGALSVNLEKIKSGEISNIYNLGNHTSVTLNEFIATCEKVVDKKAVIKILSDQKGDVPGTYADVTRASLDLGYSPETSLEDGLSKMYQWMVDNQRI